MKLDDPKIKLVEWGILKDYDKEVKIYYHEKKAIRNTLSETIWFTCNGEKYVYTYFDCIGFMSGEHVEKITEATETFPLEECKKDFENDVTDKKAYLAGCVNKYKKEFDHVVSHYVS